MAGIKPIHTPITKRKLNKMHKSFVWIQWKGSHLKKNDRFIREKTPEKETIPLKLGTFNDSGYEQGAKNLS